MNKMGITKYTPGNDLTSSSIESNPSWAKGLREPSEVVISEHYEYPRERDLRDTHQLWRSSPFLVARHISPWESGDYEDSIGSET